MHRTVHVTTPGAGTVEVTTPNTGTVELVAGQSTGSFNLTDATGNQLTDGSSNNLVTGGASSVSVHVTTVEVN